MKPTSLNPINNLIKEELSDMVFQYQYKLYNLLWNISRELNTLMDRFRKMESELLATKMSEQKFVETKFYFGEKIENQLQMNSILGNNA